MNHPYRTKDPMQHVARLSADEVRTAIREFVCNRASEDYSQGEVKLNVREYPAQQGSYEVTAEVVGPWKDES